MSIIFKNLLLTNVQKYSKHITKLCSTAVDIEKISNNTTPIISVNKYLNEELLYQKKRQVWIENLDTINEKKVGIVELHPEIYAAKPRIDSLWENIRWQRYYKFVSFAHAKTRAEKAGSTRKPWPQKGLGRARHGSRKSPLFLHGGKAHGPRSPATYFYMLPFYSRVNGLTTALSIKLAQDDLHIVNDLEIPSNSSSYIEDLMVERNWGPSVLFIDTDDIMPENITLATDELAHVNMMPVYGLNVFSMLKHDTLVLTHRAARRIEDKILHHLNRPDNAKFLKRFRTNQV
ncbi:hypothetical protein HCN44_009144 [Aphidius gifuensis]|uniref:Large ribosomal subunit protein uL4m n=1 Tax=Aphidius gifuensis TaxID=684658 RepID=A0A834Y469_APHGI|nr:39S ribosomal protein L4, mitochondrial [Aphidius gifuensis]KAF7997746.1 hypothetical protein HCN44_009144 [Aphidius gifuensis]